MVRPVREDARGIVAPEAGLTHFRLDRYPPSPPVARFVDRYWVVTWDLRGRLAPTQQVLAHRFLASVVPPVPALLGMPPQKYAPACRS